ncbi:PAS domain-containing protein [Ferrovibrio sp.]|uniref:PAS domain-containing protein n=1 Tax=Ferrovibrio sp. TaxID=1917215 RepID=UPI0035AFF3A2
MELAGPSALSQGAPSLDFASDAGRIQDSNVRQFLQLWLAARDAGPLPDKSFLDPLRLRFLLGSLSLLEVQPDPLRFRYRLIGTDIVQRLGYELTGKWLDEHPDPTIRPFILKGATMVFHAAKPVYGYAQARVLGEDWLLEVVAVPLFGPDGEVAYIGAGQSFPPGKAERPPGQPTN